MPYQLKTWTTHRRGVSIIEVLTSLAVATIGVFGVMVMIPFAIKQSQNGLDLDRSSTVAQNAIEDLEIFGVLTANPAGEAANLTVIDPITNLPFALDFAAPTVVFLDPVRLADTPAFPGGEPTFFPQLANLTTILPSSEIILGDTSTFPDALRIASATLNNPNGALFSKIEADRIFRTRDDVVVGKTNFLGVETEDVDPPQQYYNLSPLGTPITRQSEGRISWAALMVPNDLNSFRTHVLTYSSRSTLPNDVAAVSFVAEVRRGTEANPTLGKTGLEVSIRSIPIVGVYDLESAVRKDDWVMLINQRPAPVSAGSEVSATSGTGRVYSAAPAGFNIQVAFCRIVSIDNASQSLIVDGESFDFYNEDVAGPSFGPPGPAPNLQPYSSDTYVVHLPNVRNVFERTLSVER